jgi:hypothetical protein
MPDRAVGVAVLSGPSGRTAAGAMPVGVVVRVRAVVRRPDADPRKILADRCSTEIKALNTAPFLPPGTDLPQKAS